MTATATPHPLRCCYYCGRKLRAGRVCADCADLPKGEPEAVAATLLRREERRLLRVVS